MSELFPTGGADPIVDRLYMYPDVLTDDAAEMVESYCDLLREGYDIDRIMTELEDRHPVNAQKLKAWLLKDL